MSRQKYFNILVRLLAGTLLTLTTLGLKCGHFKKCGLLQSSDLQTENDKNCCPCSLKITIPLNILFFFSLFVFNVPITINIIIINIKVLSNRKPFSLCYSAVHCRGLIYDHILTELGRSHRCDFVHHKQVLLNFRRLRLRRA